jgi:hypothetical protein
MFKMKHRIALRSLWRGRCFTSLIRNCGKKRRQVSKPCWCCAAAECLTLGLIVHIHVCNQASDRFYHCTCNTYETCCSVPGSLEFGEASLQSFWVGRVQPQSSGILGSARLVCLSLPCHLRSKSSNGRSSPPSL